MAEQTAADSHSSSLPEEASNSTTQGTSAAAGASDKGFGANKTGTGATAKGTGGHKKWTSHKKKWNSTANKGASNTNKGTGTNKKATGSNAKGTSNANKQPTTDIEASTTNVGTSNANKGASTSTKGESSSTKGESSSTKGESSSTKGEIISTKGASTPTKGAITPTKGASTPTKGKVLTNKLFTPSTSQKKMNISAINRKTTCPFNSGDWQNAGHVPGAAARAKRDIASLYSQPVPGVFFVPDEDNLMCVQAMIVGNFDTPYEGGFFHFYSRFGPQYPFEPPRVCAMSCCRFGNKVRFNPNMYEDGTVCLSILGTWSGPAWTAANNLTGVLLSIQSLFCEQALCNEPGFANLRETDDKSVELYDMYVRHETLRVAVIHTIEYAEEYNIPKELVKVMKCSFMEYYHSYIASCETYKKYDRKRLSIPLISAREFIANFTKLETDLIKLHVMLTKEEAENGDFCSDNKFIKDNTLACPSSESSLSEFSDTDLAPTHTKPSDSKTTTDQPPSVSSVVSKTDLAKHKDNAASGSSSEDSVGEASKSEPRHKNKLKSLKSGGLANMMQSIVSNIKTFSSGSPGNGKTKAKSVNTKVANAVKIDSAYCEKILKEVSVHVEVDHTSSYDANIEQCLDFMSFMAESESEYEELTDSDQISDSEEEDEDKEQSTDEQLSSAADRDAGAGSSADSSSKKTTISSSPDLGTKSNEIAMEVEESEEASKLPKKMELSDDDSGSSDSSGRGCKRECTGVIKSGGGEEERGSSSSQ